MAKIQFFQIICKKNIFFNPYNFLHFLHPSNMPISKCVFLHLIINHHVMRQSIAIILMQNRNLSKFSLLMKAYRYVLWHREAFGI